MNEIPYYAPWTFEPRYGEIIGSDGLLVGYLAGRLNDGHASGKVGPLIAASPELVAELRRCTDMLSAVAGDIEDGQTLAELRGKYVTALITARDDGRAALAKAEGRTP